MAILFNSECGADLLKEDLPRDVGKSSAKASVAVLHSIPELKVSSDVWLYFFVDKVEFEPIVFHNITILWTQEAVKIGKEDEARLMNSRKLVLLVDLDQTLIHTTHENVPGNIKDVHHFQVNAETICIFFLIKENLYFLLVKWDENSLVPH